MSSSRCHDVTAWLTQANTNVGQNLFSKFQYYEIYVLCFLNYTYMYYIKNIDGLQLYLGQVTPMEGFQASLKGFKAITYPHCFQLLETFMIFLHTYIICFLTLYCFQPFDALGQRCLWFILFLHYVRGLLIPSLSLLFRLDTIFAFIASAPIDYGGNLSLFLVISGYLLQLSTGRIDKFICFM